MPNQNTGDVGLRSLPLPASYHERPDGSCLLSFGNPKHGPHEQFDIECDAATCAAIVEAVNAQNTRAAPSGEAGEYVEVPREPTEAMRIAALNTPDPAFIGDYPLYEKIWRAMLSSAPAAPGGEEDRISLHEPTNKVWCAALISCGLDPADISKVLDELQAYRKGEKIDATLDRALSPSAHPGNEMVKALERAGDWIANGDGNNASEADSVLAVINAALTAPHSDGFFAENAKKSEGEHFAENAKGSDGWFRIEPERLPDPKAGPYLFTNNIDARTAHGRMSHVWLTSLFFPADSTARDGRKLGVYAYDDGNHVISSVTHYRPIGLPTPPREA